MTDLPPEQLPEPIPDYPPPPVSGTIIPPDEIYEPPRRGCSGCAWGIGGALGCAALLILPILVLLAAGTITVQGLLGGIQGVFSAPPPAATIISSRTILTGIQPMGQLVSVGAQLAKADIYIGVQQGTFNACGFSANHVAQGAVEAGIDLTQITEDDIRYDETTNTYTVTLPPAQLTSCRIEFIRQYERSLTACNVDWDEARLLANYQALNDFRVDALESGLLTRAESETRVALTNFIAALTGGNVNIVFEEAANPSAAPSSCTPEVPAGWVYNGANNAWVKSQ